jgi:hypothetical protein
MIRPLTLSSVGLPSWSRAGWKRARIVTSWQVVESRVADPLEAVIVQAATRPSLPISSRKPTAPSSPARRAAAG